eukprot:TRINITY_DN28580_c0_g1_i1.p1 TRINITY_DN28580_c0_g1~~TRINITY_DN28580_c0_g1_i1.p1  ORF type:complete len:1007 (+),score=135.38 TRINITY_DN28580_c0_g1_i1:88-3108(+)
MLRCLRPCVAALCVQVAESCDLSAGWRYVRISNASPVGGSTCASSWDLYELRVFSAANEQLPYTIDSSAYRMSSDPPTKLYDGDTSTFWTSDPSDVKLGTNCWAPTKEGRQWVVVDLGSAQPLAFVQLVQDWTSDKFAVTVVTVECSNDNNNWSPKLTESIGLGISHAGKTFAPSVPPTRTPTGFPTRQAPPTGAPTPAPSHSPSRSPTAPPTLPPTPGPSRSPTPPPTRTPTHPPTWAPSRQPAQAPTHAPAPAPTHTPTTVPTVIPSANPSGHSSRSPSASPSAPGARPPTAAPSGAAPSSAPRSPPRPAPSGVPVPPSAAPSAQPAALAQLPGADLVDKTRDAVGVAAAIAALAASPTGALASTRAQLLLNPECPPELAEPYLPRSISPLRMRLGERDVYGGAIVGNALLIAAAFAAHLAACCAARELSRRLPALQFPRSWVAVQGTVRFPSMTLLAGLVLYTGVVTCGAVLLWQPDHSHSVALGTVGLLSAVGFAAYCTRELAGINGRAEIGSDERPGTLVGWLCGTQDWLPRAGDSVRRFGVLFRRFKSSGSRFILADLALSTVTGVLIGWLPAELPRCAARNLASSGCVLLYTAVLASMRPCIAPRANHIDVLSHATLAAGLGCLAGAQFADDRSHWGYTVGATCSLVAITALCVNVVADVYTLGHRFCTQRYWRLLRNRIIADFRRLEQPTTVSLDSAEIARRLTLCFGRPFTDEEVNAVVEELLGGAQADITPQELQDWMLGHLRGTAGVTVVREGCRKRAPEISEFPWAMPALWERRSSPLLYQAPHPTATTDSGETPGSELHLSWSTARRVSADASENSPSKRPTPPEPPEAADRKPSGGEESLPRFPSLAPTEPLSQVSPLRGDTGDLSQTSLRGSSIPNPSRYITASAAERRPPARPADPGPPAARRGSGRLLRSPRRKTLLAVDRPRHTLRNNSGVGLGPSPLPEPVSAPNLGSLDSPTMEPQLTSSAYSAMDDLLLGKCPSQTKPQQDAPAL